MNASRSANMSDETEAITIVSYLNNSLIVGGQNVNAAPILRICDESVIVSKSLSLTFTITAMLFLIYLIIALTVYSLKKKLKMGSLGGNLYKKL